MKVVTGVSGILSAVVKETPGHTFLPSSGDRETCLYEYCCME